MLVKRSEIRAGLRVRDSKTPEMIYTWISGGRFINGELISWVCDNCSFSDQFILQEDFELGGLPLGKFCVDCAGLDDLEPIVQLVK